MLLTSHNTQPYQDSFGLDTASRNLPLPPTPMSGSHRPLPSAPETSNSLDRRCSWDDEEFSSFHDSDDALDSDREFDSEASESSSIVPPLPPRRRRSSNNVLMASMRHRKQSEAAAKRSKASILLSNTNRSQYKNGETDKRHQYDYNQKISAQDIVINNTGLLMKSMRDSLKQGDEEAVAQIKDALRNLDDEGHSEYLKQKGFTPIIRSAPEKISSFECENDSGALGAPVYAKITPRLQTGGCVVDTKSRSYTTLDRDSWRKMTVGPVAGTAPINGATGSSARSLKPAPGPSKTPGNPGAHKKNQSVSSRFAVKKKSGKKLEMARLRKSKANLPATKISSSVIPAQSRSVPSFSTAPRKKSPLRAKPERMSFHTMAANYYGKKSGSYKASVLDFEKRKNGKDAVLSVAMFRICVSREGKEWLVFRSYQQFVSLDNRLKKKKVVGKKDIKITSKKAMVVLSPKKRAKILDGYIQKLLALLHVTRSPYFQNFIEPMQLGDIKPDKYAAMQQG